MTTPICCTNFMTDTLKLFSKEETQQWFRNIWAIDAAIGDLLEKHPSMIENMKLRPELIALCEQKLSAAGLSTDYNLRNIEAFFGYNFFVAPDNGLKALQSNNPELNYGIAKATTQGLPHRHFQSPAFNYILAGEGVFTGDPLEEGMFPNFYHGKSLIEGVELEIPIGMTHGHLVKRGSVLWLLAVQECSFAPGKGCAGDFHVVPRYDETFFSAEYQLEGHSHEF